MGRHVHQDPALGGSMGRAQQLPRIRIGRQLPEGPIRIKAGGSPADISFYAALLHRLDDAVAEIIHIGEGNGTGGQHLGDAQQAAPIYVLTRQLVFKGKNPVVQPPVQRHIVPIAPQQRHGNVGMAVKEAGDQQQLTPELLPPVACGALRS